MQTLVLQQPGEFRLTATPEPDHVPPGQARVRVHHVGVCGTDWHALHGRHPFFSYPRIPGHELGVEILELNPASGHSTHDLEPGDRCTVEPYLHCGQCIACRREKPNACTQLQVLGIHTDGGMREQILVPIEKLHRSNTLSLERLALIEMLAIGCHAVQRAQPEAGEHTLIVGAGPIGLSIIPFLLGAGVAPIVVETAAHRRRFCQEQFDLEHVLPDTDAIRDLTDGEGPTLVFDATGHAGSMQRCFELPAPTGRLVLVGVVQDELCFHDPELHRRELTVLASRNASPADFQSTIALAECGEIDTQAWLTHRAAAEQFLASLDEWQRTDTGLIKAMIDF